MQIVKVPAATPPLKVDKVEYRDTLVGDLIAAEMLTGKTEGWNFAAAVLSQVATFDGQNLPPEEIRRLPQKDFLALLGALELDVPEISPSASFTSLAKEISESPA